MQTFLCLCLILTLAISGCSATPTPEDVAQAQSAALAARDKLNEVAAFLEAAKPAAGALPVLREELAAFREAYESELYSDAAAHLRAALDAASKSGVAVPAEVPRRLAEAELLLGLLGK